jgi:hypothetical protein
MEENTCKLQDLIIQVKLRNKVKFKAGAELSGKVNIANIEVNEEHIDDSHVIHLHLAIKKQACESAPVKP